MFTDVVIVGGGLTGCTAAYVFAAAGIRVVLLEAEQIGRGATAFGSGWMSGDPGGSFGELEKAHGLRAARYAWQVWHRAALDFAALLGRLRIRCSLGPGGAVTAALGQEQAARLKRDQKARVQAGLDAPWLTARIIQSETGLEAAAGIRTKAGAVLDPYRAAVGLAASARHRGARLFEHSSVSRIAFGRRTADVETADGTIRTARVIVATGEPTVLFRALQRHFWFRRAHLVLTDPVPAAIRRRLGSQRTVVRDSAAPPHVVRWGGDNRLLVMGADTDVPASRLREQVLVQRTGQLMYQLSTLYPDISGIRPAYGWDASFARAGDDLPVVGPHRNYPFHLFAFGGSSRSVTTAYLASRILLRHHLDQVQSGDGAFEFR